MADKLNLSFTTPSAHVADREVDGVVLPAAEGEIGILPGHDEFMSILDIGLVTVTADGKDEVYFIAGGYFEVSNDHLILLAEVAETTGQIDVERAKAAKKRAEERLAAAGDEVDAARAEKALKRAEFRLEVAAKARAN